ncbi:MAG: hypothetical protein COV70_00255 [Parcubacteria group bacterium CG11_big_fil_rev_8_21_14_0_20_39_22]|nr:MAG: hypothetical protein COV70_00255 [Parcubacteria group bacterium CG11_big_fil_rev_8_21_14_0_20_39_22]
MQDNIKILMIGSDRKMFQSSSVVRQRLLDQAKHFDEIHVVVFSRKKVKAESLQISDNCWLHSTNSFSRWSYISNAIDIGSQIIKNDSQSRWVITCQDPFEAGLVGLKISKNTGTKLHIQIHTDFLSPFFYKGGFLNRIRIHIANRVITKADGIRAVSKKIKDSLLSKYSNIPISKVSILPIYLDSFMEKSTEEDYLHKKYPQFSFIILMMSRLTKEKNIRCAIKSLKHVVERYPRVGLVIVGSGSELTNLKLKTSGLKLTGNVVFEDWTDDPYSYYNSANAFLQTSWYEGFGVSLVQSLRSGLPAISTDVGIARDILVTDKVSFVCPPNDDKCIAEKIVLLIDDNQLRAMVVNDQSSMLTDFVVDNKDEYFKVYAEDIKRVIK